MAVHHAHSDGEFSSLMATAGSGPVVVDFFATWCGPCKFIEPHYDALAVKYKQVYFVKVDVDKCKDTASAHGVNSMPTFLMFVNRQKVDSFSGADKDALESMIKRWASAVPAERAPGQLDLTPLVDKTKSECLNEDNGATLLHVLEQRGSLRSDCDEQLLINVGFQQSVKLHSILFRGPGGRAPKNVKVFVNMARTPDFDAAEASEPVQQIVLGDSVSTEDGELVQLRFVKFQNVNSVVLFVANNQAGGEVTELSELAFYGTPLGSVNMEGFKRVAGKAGEAH